MVNTWKKNGVGKRDTGIWGGSWETAILNPGNQGRLR